MPDESISTAKHWIRTLNLEPHPEGGWYREVYRAAESIPHASLPDRFTGDRHFSTAIYFLLDGTNFSAFHRICQDELWHFYDGSPLTIHSIDPAGNYSTTHLGRNTSADQSLLAVVPAGHLFGATVDDPTSYSLVGCTVAPGFDFNDFHLPTRTELLDQYPQHHQIITQLTHQ